MNTVDLQATLARLAIENTGERDNNCSVCRELDERKARNTCTLSHGQWCAQGWHWEFMNWPGYTFENAVVMCPNEMARLAGIRRREKMRAQHEMAQRVAAEARDKRNTAKLTQEILETAD